MVGLVRYCLNRFTDAALGDSTLPETRKIRNCSVPLSFIALPCLTVWLTGLPWLRAENQGVTVECTVYRTSQEHCVVLPLLVTSNELFVGLNVYTSQRCLSSLGGYRYHIFFVYTICPVLCSRVFDVTHDIDTSDKVTNIHVTCLALHSVLTYQQ